MKICEFSLFLVSKLYYDEKVSCLRQGFKKPKCYTLFGKMFIQEH